MNVGPAQTRLAENEANKAALSTAILTAYLLTGTLAAAEASVAEAIRFGIKMPLQIPFCGLSPKRHR